MPKFLYAAVNTRGHEVTGAVWANNEQEARVQLQVRRYDVKSLREDLSRMAWLERQLARMRPPSLLELAVTTRQLAVMLQAGLSINQALQILVQQPLGRALGESWVQVEKEVSSGVYLSKSLSRFPALFSGLYVGLCKAGEASGSLPANLSRLADHLEREVALRRKVQAALTYPMFVFASCLGLSVLIVQHILPQFLNGIFKDASIELPWMTKSLIVVTAFFNNPVALVSLAFGLAGGGWLLSNYARTPAGRFQMQQLALGTPTLRVVIQKILTSRFCRTMSTLLRSGIPVVQALDLTSEAVDNRVMADHLQQAVADLKDGQPLHMSLRAVPIFPSMMGSFVELGEDTGKLPELMERLADTFDEELELALVAFTQLIEPVMVAIMGGMVAYVMVAIFIPLYQILGNF